MNENFEVFFDIDGTVEWIRSCSYKRVALQFPDIYLSISVDVANLIEIRSDSKTFIVADSSYRSCCVDEITAQHANVDCIVHYGEACLSKRTGNLPVRYVFGNSAIDFSSFKSKLCQYEADLTGKCVLLYDTQYANLAEAIIDCIKTSLCHVELIHLNLMIEKNGSDSSSVSLARHIPSDFHNYSFLTVIFVGDEDSAILPLWLLTHVNCSKVFTYFPKTGDASLSCSNATQHLRKRLFLIEKIRDATTIGLVVGTIDTLGHREVVKRMRKLCRAAGKKLYVFSIGKVNEAKISNFANDIDIFVIISCPLGVILDKRNYIRPLVSLFEAEIALNDYHDWSCGKGWTAEFSNFVNDAIEVNGLKEPDISMITGRLRTNGCDEVDESSNYCRDICSYVAGNHFGTRSWKGLDDVSTGMETLQLQEGRSGIASGYNIEPVDA